MRRRVGSASTSKAGGQGGDVLRRSGSRPAGPEAQVRGISLAQDGQRQTSTVFCSGIAFAPSRLCTRIVLRVGKVVTPQRGQGGRSTAASDSTMAGP